ncbi:hypothetical protein WB401_14010 [Streptomyces brasiliscabiei]|uniref:Integral membrane protein n=1 Tax=Streptomyces brasiliscabiei TaxID=2736302 RepID=A0ABU8GC98_9ACTN
MSYRKKRGAKDAESVRSGGAADIAMGWLGVLASASLLVKVTALTRHGASPTWSMIVGALVVLSVHRLYRIRRDRPESTM